MNPADGVPLLLDLLRSPVLVDIFGQDVLPTVMLVRIGWDLNNSCTHAEQPLQVLIHVNVIWPEAQQY